MSRGNAPLALVFGLCRRDGMSAAPEAYRAEQPNMVFLATLPARCGRIVDHSNEPSKSQSVIPIMISTRSWVRRSMPSMRR